MYYIIDTHAHYDDEAFQEDREALLCSMQEHGVGRIVNSGATMQGVRDTIALTEKYSFVYGTAGVHPSEVKELESEEHWNELEQAVLHEKILAVGEIGLDYHWDEPERELQKLYFEKQLELARRVKKPVVIHSRDAAAHTLEIMKANHCEEIGGIIHCFSYGKEMAREFLEMGFYLGIGGVLTFQNAKKLKEVVTFMPMERIVLETDSPYLAPVPFRGERNSSRNLPYVVEKIAELKQMTTDEVIRITYENACRVYQMKERI